MANHDPKQEIIEHLISLKMSDASISPSLSNNKQTAHEERQITKTFRFIRERNIANYQISVVAIEDGLKQEALFTNYLAQDKQGNWHLRDSIGTSNQYNTLERDQPWLNLNGGGWPHHFFASGSLSGHNHQDIQHVHLITANGVILEDTVDDGLVLFLTDQKVKLPFYANLYNQAGELVNSHSVFTGINH